VSAAANTSQSPPAAGAARSRATKLSRSYNDLASRTTTPRLGKISAYQVFDHDQFFDTGHRSRARATPARARADASRRAGACDASFATATALSAPRHTAYLVLRRLGFKSYEGCRRPFFFLLLNGSQYMGATIHVHAYRRALYRPRLRPGRARCFIPRLVWNRDLSMILQTRKVDECRPLPACRIRVPQIRSPPPSRSPGSSELSSRSLSAKELKCSLSASHPSAPHAQAQPKLSSPTTPLQRYNTHAPAPQPRHPQLSSSHPSTRGGSNTQATQRCQRYRSPCLPCIARLNSTHITHLHSTLRCESTHTANRTL
jgi:hypothetical protein